ncbi:hypothetical protein SAMN05421881_1003102 [Nitrosomonas halophila]|uniref:Uncharacterized protein n=1 Tax=Nitrosomonas halophila TaxID=44576 RepID=A0A1H3CSE3_9PROT|nr:hypothetical protein SAMN05421881_1003102 [Nitrosomonas halophila]
MDYFHAVGRTYAPSNPGRRQSIALRKKKLSGSINTYSMTSWHDAVGALCVLLAKMTNSSREHLVQLPCCIPIRAVSITILMCIWSCLLQRLMLPSSYGVPKQGKTSASCSQSNLSTHTLELLNKRGNLLENALLLRQVLRIQRTHFWQNGIQLGAIVAGKLPL